MKAFKFAAVILSLAILTSCDPAQTEQESETVSETETSAATTAAETKTEKETVPEASAATTAEAETETEKETVPADDDIAFDNELVSALADIIERHNGYNFFMYDFNLDGCPEIAFYGYDMATQYCAVYDFSGGNSSNYAYAVPGQCTEDENCDMCIELYANTAADEKFYISFSRYILESADGGFIYCQDIYRTPLSGDILGGIHNGNDANKSVSRVYTREEYEQLFTDAAESLSEYTLVEHINPDNFKNYTVYDPSPYDPSPRELAVTVLKDYYVGE